MLLRLHAVRLTLLCLFFYFSASFVVPTTQIWIYQIIFFLLPAVGLLLKSPPSETSSSSDAFWKRLHLQRPSLKSALFIAVLTVVIALLLEIITIYWNRFIPLPQNYKAYYEGLLKRETPWNIGLQVITMGLVPAIAEEFLFRGFLQNALLKCYSIRGSILITAGLFGISHLNPWYFPFYFILGIYLGWCQNYRQTLILPILAHWMNNIIALLAFRIV